MERFIESFDKIRIYYRYKKENTRQPVLVFLHGIGANWTVWKEEIKFFDRMDYSTLAFDLRGHGLSEIPVGMKPYNFENFSKDLKCILDKEKIKNFVLIGHSLGGAVAINYCGMYPKSMPSAMILVETAHRYPFEHHKEFNVNPWVATLVRFVAEHEHFRKHHFPLMRELDFTKEISKSRLGIFWNAIHVTPLKSILSTIDSVQEYSFNHLQQTEEMLKSLRIPVQIIAGSEDTTIPVQFSEELHWLIKNSELKVLVGAYHRVPLQEPEELSLAILSFLKKLKKKHVKKKTSKRKTSIRDEIIKLRKELAHVRKLLKKKKR